MALAENHMITLTDHAENVVHMPRNYRPSVPWVPHVGDIFPNFTAVTTHGTINFHDWAEGSWVVLFNQPKVKGSVSTTEMAALAHAQDDFDRRNVKLLGLSEGSVSEIIDWESIISDRFRGEVDFPMISDPEFVLSAAFGMSHWKQSWDHAVRKAIVVTPGLKVCYVSEFPMNMGRSVEELLRVMDAQQLHHDTCLVTPADWQPGEPAMVPIYMPPEKQYALYGDRMVDLYDGMRMVPTELDERLHGKPVRRTP